MNGDTERSLLDMLELVDTLRHLTRSAQTKLNQKSGDPNEPAHDLKESRDTREIFFETMSHDTLRKIADVLTEQGIRCPGPTEGLWFLETAKHTQAVGQALQDKDPVRAWALLTYAGVLRSLAVIWSQQQGAAIEQLTRYVDASKVFSIIHGNTTPEDHQTNEEDQ